jgi:hypothetical protein
VSGETLKVRGKGMSGLRDEDILAAPGKETQALGEAQMMGSRNEGGFGEEAIDIKPPLRVSLHGQTFPRRPDAHDQNPARTEKEVLELLLPQVKKVKEGSGKPEIPVGVKAIDPIGTEFRIGPPKFT